MSKLKTEEEKKIILESGNWLDRFINLLKNKDKTLQREKIAEIMNVSKEQLSKFTKGINSPPFFRIYQFLKNYNLSSSDIAFLFGSKINETVPLKTLPLSHSDNPEINKKINILKQIYESGDKILISSVDYCLKGAYDDFLKKQKKEIA